MGAPLADLIIPVLRKWPLWDQVPREILEEFCTGVESLSIRRKRAVFRRGEPGPGLLLIRRGELKIGLISNEGREQILYLAEAGKMVCEGFLPAGIPCAASAFVMEDAEIWRFETARVLRLIHRSESLNQALMYQLAFRANRLIDLILDISLHSVETRLATFILGLAERLGAEPGKPCIIPRNLDMNTVAARLGTVREEVSRALNRMDRRNIIKLSRQEIMVLDLEALEQLTFG